MQQPSSRPPDGSRDTRPTTPRLQFSRARSYQVLRTAHLERAHDFAPASILYADRRYDFDPTLAARLDLHRCGPVGLVRILLANPLVALEINEPLQLSGLPRRVGRRSRPRGGSAAASWWWAADPDRRLCDRETWTRSCSGRIGSGERG